MTDASLSQGSGRLLWVSSEVEVLHHRVGASGAPTAVVHLRGRMSENGENFSENLLKRAGWMSQQVLRSGRTCAEVKQRSSRGQAGSRFCSDGLRDGSGPASDTEEALVVNPLRLCQNSLPTVLFAEWFEILLVRGIKGNDGMRINDW